MEDRLIKYPRTRHLEGSKLQQGDEDLSQVPFSEIKGKYIVIEEKIDGANVAISFGENNELLLQSRGHYLTGGFKERHYDLFKQWACVHQDSLFKILGQKYIMFGEWMYAKHAIYYDNLPHYFIEFDIYDKEKKFFLDTNRRKELLKDTKIVSAKVLKEGVFNHIDEVLKYIGNSYYITPDYISNLKKECIKQNLDIEYVLSHTSKSMLMEGLYIKIEDEGIVKDRMKYVRYDYHQEQSLDSSDWFTRAIVPNMLNKPLNDLFD